MYLRKDPEILLRETKERVGFPVKWSSTGGFAYGSIFFVFSWISLFTRGIFIETLSVSFLIEFFFMGKDATMEATALRFRHYTPRDEALRSLCVGKEDIEASVAATVEKELSIIETYRTKFEDPSLERDNIVPKKVTGDLRRILQPRFDRLERETQQSLIGLLPTTASTEHDTNVETQETVPLHAAIETLLKQDLNENEES
uniref:Uncharacterized protein n=1 Tax=Compsopogon caeruleus TaxID=31354 RepID=A0A7S1XGC4_9RHOD|mmetsp:Transcript_6630/g.13449  ORF Transcript_6630/g.13449 Transcript_6630/m.13449 type:complete len:201 (+) Transcript_6630:720-1322(+)